ncbi:MAG: hypothetical protein OP8BY_1500 [Candidatus Saccharicenans subterraneus]|uniref:Uncharacterized protein n=1 Tax=Candidatus Saccharicenans subterraneus TaxID=2508984 RepID=A0A3E2BJJ3_9BACT|nr:MAG: hypothetical protein OP8BY_1500 [Candidatus Saccharicenans subterraneum]
MLTGLENNGKKFSFVIFYQPAFRKRPEPGPPSDVFSEDQSRFVNIL